MKDEKPWRARCYSCNWRGSSRALVMDDGERCPACHGEVDYDDEPPPDLIQAIPAWMWFLVGFAIPIALYFIIRAFP